MDADEEAVRKLTKPRDKAVAMDTGALMEKIKNSEDLQLKLESSLSNQNGEKLALITLTNENAMLKKHHDDMKLKYDNMYHGYSLLLDDVESLKRTEQRQKNEITQLREDIEELRRTQGGDRNMGDMQDRLIRLTDDQAQKDLKIYKLELLLEDSGTESRTKSVQQQSAVCVIL